MYDNLNVDNIVEMVREYGLLSEYDEKCFTDILTQSDWIDKKEVEKLNKFIDTLPKDEFLHDEVDEFLVVNCQDILNVLHALRNGEIYCFDDRDSLLWDLAETNGGIDYFRKFIDDNEMIKEMLFDDYLTDFSESVLITEDDEIIQWI